VAVATAVNTALRRTILATVENPFVERTVRRHGMKLGARRFVAAETLEEALDVLARLNVQGLLANTTILGEEVSEPDEARAVASAYLRVLERIRERELRVNVALKLTHLGLLIDEELAFANVARVVDHAAALGNFVRIDMEHSAVVDATLRIYRRLRDGGRDAVGAVLQSYLYRSERDLEELLPLRPNLRIVKGAYLEPPSVAYPRKRDVDAAFARLVESGMGSGAYIAVATHDERLLEHAIATASSCRCSTASGRISSSPSSNAASRSGSRRRTDRSGTRSSCGGSPSARRTSSSSCETSSGGEFGYRATMKTGARVRTVRTWMPFAASTTAIDLPSSP
jgi:proline dehydrogenase